MKISETADDSGKLCTQTGPGTPALLLRTAALAALVFLLALYPAAAETLSPPAIAPLPDAPSAVALRVAALSPAVDSLAGNSPAGDLLDAAPASAQATTQTPDAPQPTAAAPQTAQPGAAPQSDDAKEEQRKQGAEVLKKQEQQRILGIMPAFNSVYSGTVPPLTPGQKFQLMFKSTTDPYVFVFAAFTAGIGQAQDSHAAYGQGVEGYAKRFGANYVDTADGNLWGNAILPVLMHEDPRYFRLGHGTFKHRLLYSMSTSVICRRDNGTTGPNYANVLGNLIAGGFSNLYYPAADRGAAQTFQSAATVTAEGMIGAALIEFWPDITNHYHLKRQARRDADAAAARNAQQTRPLPIAPQ